jgi:GNAT superfamily N-acetyltransferase
MHAKHASHGVRIRTAEKRDAEAIAELCAQLGYPSTAGQILERLRKLLPREEHAVFVAAAQDEAVTGWAHVSVQHLVEVDTRAEVNGLVVSEGRRGRGTGRLLLQTAEEWARAHGCHSMFVRSNVIRERAHGFYLREGYEHHKLQKAFRKKL